MPAKRRDVREAAFLLSFEKLFRDETLDDIFMTAKEMDEFPFDEEAQTLVRGIFDKAEELDEIIGKYSNKRTVSRIPKINLAILRLAVYEALYDEKVPVNVAISEAVSLAERFAQPVDISFVNGILGAFAKDNSKEK